MSPQPSPEYQASLDAIARRRAIANEMAQGAMTYGPTQMSGTGRHPIAVATSPWEVLTKLGTAYLAKKENASIDKDYGAIATAMKSDRAKALEGLIPKDTAPSYERNPMDDPDMIGPQRGIPVPGQLGKIGPQAQQAAIDAGVDPSVVTAAVKPPTQVNLARGEKRIDETGRVIATGDPLPDYEPQKLAAAAAAAAETVRHNKASEGNVTATREAAKANGFGTAEGDVLAAMAERGVSLPAGFRSKEQQLSLVRGLIARNPDASPADIADKVASGQMDFHSQGKGVQQFSSGKIGTTIRSLNVAVQHLDQLGKLADALNNGDVPLFNKIGNAYSTQTGSAAPTNFAAAKKVVADEIVKAIVGSGGGVSDREEAANSINAAQSPEQLAGVIQTYQGLMTGQLNGIRQQYKDSTGRDDFEDKLLPETRAKIESHGQTAQQAQAPAPEQTATGPNGQKLALRNGQWVPL